MDIAKLKELALAAIGHGEAIGENEWYSEDENMSIFSPSPDLSFVAAANPAAIIELIAIVERQEVELAESRKAAESAKAGTFQTGKPVGCSGDPSNCPDNEGYGCSCSPSTDAVVEANVTMMRSRSAVGIKKYGVTLADSGLPLRSFLVHALEESLDHANYIQAAMQAIDREAQASAPAVPPVTPKHIEEIKDILLWPVTEDDARVAREMLQALHFDLPVQDVAPQQHSQAAQQNIVAYELHGHADHDGRESPEVRIVFTRKQSDEYAEDGWTLYREFWSSKPTRSFVGEQTVRTDFSVTRHAQAALSDDDLYKRITDIIFERYPRIKGVHCASIAYGLIEFISQQPASNMPTACTRPQDMSISGVDSYTSQAAAAPGGHAEVDKMLATNQLDELGAEVARLQTALCFWLPSVTDREDDVAERILQDAFLLCGIDGNIPDDFKTAQELGWVSLAAAPLTQPQEAAALDKMISRDNFYADVAEDIAHALAHELEDAELNPGDLVTVNRAKLMCIAKRVIEKASADLAAPAAQVAVPEGWVLVPKVLTDSMQKACNGPLLLGPSSLAANQARHDRILSAAPSPVLPAPGADAAQITDTDRIDFMSRGLFTGLHRYSGMIQVVWMDQILDRHLTNGKDVREAIDAAIRALNKQEPT